MGERCKVTKGHIAVRFGLELMDRKTPDWREPLNFCPVFSGIQEDYGAFRPELEPRIAKNGNPYYLDHKERKTRWIRPLTRPSLSCEPIFPNLMPPGWIRQWSVAVPAKVEPVFEIEANPPLYPELDAQTQPLELDPQTKPLELDSRMRIMELDSRMKLIELDSRTKPAELDAPTQPRHLDVQPTQLYELE
ncbi:hypothetical protein F5Y16DRAFT_178628 [Xylariaceae sp. FL0255]|nr:hypothetical protein F5Y16DRAFT_178628 [Xylariaceae sp. FL0255]